MSYIYKVFEHLKQLWMGIWQHTHTVTTTELSPDLGELAEILDDLSVEMIPLRYHLGCRTFQTASHIPVSYTHLTLSQIWGYFCGGNGMNVLPYPHPQLFKMFKHLIYV